jgi:uncharacterized protein YndB with AHSA1/START domain
MKFAINEAKPGGKISYEWTNGKGHAFSLTGEYLELIRPALRLAVPPMLFQFGEQS